MSEQNLSQLQDFALDEVKRAERAFWAHFLEFVKADIGPDLAQWLDTTYGGYESRPDSWRVNTARVWVALRIPDCTEIALCYSRGRGQDGSIADYRNLQWQATTWNSNARSDRTSGKFAAVRYEIKSVRPEEAKVEP